jgi:ABC-type transport system involved in multi-copper enzyme maturation permease subunit
MALDSGGWMRISLLTLVSLVYIGVFFFIGLAISALARRSATAVVLLLAIWVVLALVVPNVGWLVAKRVIEVPSQQQIETEKFKTARQIEDETEKKHPSGRLRQVSCRSAR